MNWIKNTIHSIWESFTNNAGGLSSKKLTIFAITTTSFCTPMLMWAWWAYKHNDWSLFPALLGIVSATILGLFTANIIDKVKNPEPPKDPEQK